MPRIAGAAAEYAARVLGGFFTQAQITATITPTAAQLAGGDPERTAVVIVNLGLFPVYIGFGPDVSASSGILLSPSGGSMAMDYREDLTLVTLGIYAISSGGNSDVFAHSLRRVGAIKAEVSNDETD